MKPHAHIAAAAFAALASLATASHAEGLYIYGATGWTIEAGEPKESSDLDLQDSGETKVQTSQSTGTPSKLLVGYEVNPYFAVEGGYYETGQQTYSGSAGGKPFATDVSGAGLQMAAMTIVPINARYSAYAKMGYTALRTKTAARVNSTRVGYDTQANTGGYGVGTLYRMTEHLALRTELEAITDKVTVFTVGLQYKF